MSQPPPSLPEEPRAVLNRAATWLGRVGAALVLAGALVAIYADAASGSYPLIKMILAILLWVVPGVIYLVTARGLSRRRRWAITSADVTTYAQMGLAGVIILVSLLFLKVLWPLIVISLAWLAVLVQTPRRLIGLSLAMDQLAARVTDR